MPIFPPIFRFTALVLLVLVLTACGQKPGPGKLYWIQPLKGHPVHQMTQIAFKAGCAKEGFVGEIIGTDAADIGGTIALAEQVIARGDAKGLAVWANSPAWKPLIERARRAGIPVVIPHFPMPEGSLPGATGVIACDPAAYAREAARFIGEQIKGAGTVAITQGGFNSTENQVSEVFIAELRRLHPAVKVVGPEEEGFDPAKSIAKAAAILQANPGVVAALSTTGGGPITWAGAQKETGRRLVVVGVDYTRVNLDLIERGEVQAVIAQPLWEESFGAAGLLATVVKGGKIPWWTTLPAPLVGKDGLGPYRAILDQVEAAIRK